MRPSRPLSWMATTMSATRSPGVASWSHCTVEWSPKVAQLKQQQRLSKATQFVFPDLPKVFSPLDRKEFLISTSASQQIQTIALCRHKSWKSLVAHPIVQATSHESKLLLVGGNDKGADTLSTIEATKILQSETEADLWGVANPNDPSSVAYVHEKHKAGITGFITQPLLSSTALDTLEKYPSAGKTDDNVTLIAGAALPKTARGLQFWCKLLEQPELVEDPLFQSHLAFFSQPYYTSIAWIGRELQNLATQAPYLDGVHFMPLKNTDDLETIFQSLNIGQGTATLSDET